MKLNIKGQEIELKYTLRTNVIYESIMGDKVDYNALEQVTVVLTLLYANIVATLQAQHIDMTLTYDEYMDWIDSNNGLVILNEYAVWLSEEMQMQFGLIPQNDNTDTKKKSRKKKTD